MMFLHLVCLTVLLLHYQPITADPCHVVANGSDTIGDTCECLSPEELKCQCSGNLTVYPDDERLLGKNQIHHLIFEDCIIPNITAELFRDYTKLSNLSLTNLKIDMIANDAFSMNTPDLKTLKIKESIKTGLNKIPKMPPFMKELYIENAAIEELDMSQLNIEMLILDLSHNPISQLPRQFKNHFGNLQEFWCQACQFTEVPLNLPPTLSALILRENQIINISKETPFPPMNHLSQLDLRDNQLVYLWNETFRYVHARGDYHDMIYIDLRNNHLTYLSDEVINDIYQNVRWNGSIIHFGLHNNPLNCDCRWMWLLENQAFRKDLFLGGLCILPKFMEDIKVIRMQYEDFRRQGCPGLPQNEDDSTDAFIIVAIVVGCLVLIGVAVLVAVLSAKKYYKGH